MFKIIGVDCVADDSNFVIKNSDITTGGNAINISKSVNGEITGSTINVTGNNRIINCSGGTSNLTIIDSDLNNEKSASKREGIIMYAGTLNIKGTTKIKSGGAAIYSSEDSDITVNIESGEIESTNLQAIVMNKANGNINIGKKDEEVHTDSPILKSAISEWTIRSDMMNLNFYDGKLIGGQYKIIGASIDNLADGCDLVNSKYTDESGKDVEEIHLGEAEGEAELIKNGSESGEKYGTLKEAVEKADNTQNSNNQITIKVLKDIYQAHQITIEENQNIKIDLNGNKFFAMTDEALYNKGTLEIIDNTKTDLETEPESDDDYNLIGSTGAVIIHNVGVKNGDETSSKGKLTLGKGVKVNYTASGTSKGYKKVISNDGELKTDGATITVSGNYIHVIDNTEIIELNGGKITTNGTNTYAVYSENAGENTDENTDEKKTSIIKNVKISTTGSNSYGVYNNGNGTIEIGSIKQKDEETQIDETTEISSTNSAITNNSNGKIIINGGNIKSSADDCIENVDKGTIEINGGKIEGQSQSTSYCAIKNTNGGIVNIIDGEIISNSTGIYNYNSKDPGTINIKGGTIKSNKNYGVQNGYTKEGIVNITGGTIISEDKYGVYNHVGTLTLGEKIKEEGDEVDTENPSIKGKKYGVYNDDKFNFYDGAITGPIDNTIYGAITDHEDGYQIIKTKNEDGETETATLHEVDIFELKDIQSQESMGKYKTVEKLQAKLDKLDNNKKYKIDVLADFSIKSTERLEIPKGLTVTIDLKGFTATTAIDYAIKNNGNLTIMDSSENSSGNIVSEVNGTKEKYNSVVHNGENAELNIISGKITSKGLYGYGLYNGKTGKVLISGGTIEVSGSNGRGIQNEGELELSTNTITVSGSNSYDIYNDNDEKTVKIKSSTIKNTNGTGIYNAKAGAIEIGKIENSDEASEQTKNTVIETSSYAIDNEDNGKITIDGAEITTKSASSIYNYSTGTIDMKNIKISMQSSYNNAYGIYNNKGGTINLISGELTSNHIGIGNNSNNEKAGTITIQEGVTIESSSYAVYNNGTNGNEEGTINIIGGKITSQNNYGIYNYYGILNLGEKIKDTETVLENKPNENNPIVKGKTFGVYNMGTFNYYDGEISGATGQSINSNITELEKDYQVVKSVNDNIETARLEKIDIMEIDNEVYQVVTDAINEIKSFNENGEHQIKLLKDMYMTESQTIIIPENTKVKLDLNGHVLETSSETTIENNGNLEITDTSEEKNGKIMGISATIIDNKNHLIINNGSLETINYVSVRDNKYFTKIINNTNQLEWNNGNLIITTGCSYGIYNTDTGTLEWNNGNIYLDTKTDRITEYGIYVKGTGDINIKKVLLETTGFTGNQTYSYQYYIYSPKEENDKEKVTININDFTMDEESNSSGKKYGICGYNLDLNISGGHFKGFFSEGINLNNSEIEFTGGTFDNEIIVPDGTKLTINGKDVKIDDIENSGELNIENGTIRHINSRTSTSDITMTGGSIYNEKGDALEIKSGTFTLLGGNIESTKGNGVDIDGSNATFTMGEDDQVLSNDVPQVKGSTYGIYNNSEIFNFYDGIVQGGVKAIYGVVSKTPENHKVKINKEETEAILGTISDTEDIVSVGNMYYDNMESAIEQASRVSEKILVHTDLKLVNQLTIDKDAEVIIDLNGHHLTAEISGTLFTNDGKLTIIDTSQNDDSSGSAEGAKIENTKGFAITNNKTLIIGVEDKIVNKNTPQIKGTPKAIQNNGTVYWYDGKINEETTEHETEITSEMNIIKSKIKSSAENIIQELQETLKAIVQSPIIKVNKEFPIWTNESVTATIYVPSRIILDIVNDNENAEVQSIIAKKVWKMSEEEAKNYRATIQLMKKKDGEIVPALDRNGNIITLKIIGNDSQTFANVPIYENGNKIEYVLKEIKVEKRTSEEDDDWEELPLNEFSVTYEDE